MTTPVQFGLSSNMMAGSGVTARTARLTERFLSTSGKLVAEQKMAKSNFFTAKLRRMASQLFSYDFVDTRAVGRFTIVDPPFGSVLFWMYPVVTTSRYIRSAIRDKINNTEVEKGDSLRRDLSSITLFIFGVPPLKNLLTRLNQKISGMRLANPAGKGLLSGPAFGYQQMTDCLTYTRPEVLEAIITDGNGKGVEKALKRLHKYYSLVLQKQGLATQEQDVLNKITQAKEKITAAVREQHSTGLRRTPKVTELTHEAFDILNNAQADFTRLKSLVAQGEGFNKMFKPAHRLLRGFGMKDAVADFAKMKRMPADLIAFLTVVVALGWFPVWFNDLLSRKRRAQQDTSSMQQNIMLSAPPSTIPPSPFKVVR